MWKYFVLIFRIPRGEVSESKFDFLLLFFVNVRSFPDLKLFVLVLVSFCSATFLS